MKLEEAVKIGRDCGLTTYQEALDNINYHVLNIFVYDEIEKELEELYGEFSNSGHNLEDKI